MSMFISSPFKVLMLALMGHLPPPTLGHKHRVLSRTVTDGRQRKVYLTDDQQRQGD